MSDDANNDPIGRALGVTPMNNKDVVQTMIRDAHSDSATTDFEYARANLRELSDTAAEAVKTLADVADKSQNPRAYEVLAKLIDSSINANKSMLDLQEKVRTIQAADGNVGGTAKTINNNLFVGSTAELQKMLEKIKNGPNESTDRT